MLSKTGLFIHFMIFIIAGSVLLPGCTKHKPAEPIENAAYIRVFNSIAAGVEPTDIGGSSPFLAFLMDPAGEADGTFTGADVMCDYLNTRQLSSQSYPTDADTDPAAPSRIVDATGAPLYRGIVNFEYPGKAHVPAAPAMNGFDMSSWAQVKPGKHRIVFVVRPRNNTPFASLDKRIRKNVLIDTTLELQAGEVYTVQALQTSKDNPITYGAYVRTEDFYKQSFEGNKIYVGFDNISGKYPLAAQTGFLNFFNDTVNIYYSYLMRDIITTANTTLPILGMQHLFYTTISNKQAGKIGSYLSLPLLPRAYFFYKDSTLKKYPTNLQKNNSNTNGVQPDEDIPFVKLDFYNYNAAAQKVLSINCSANPVTLQYYDQNIPYVRTYLPSLNLILNNNNRINIYPTVSIMEICYDRVYMMQMQRAFNEVPR